MRSPWMRSEPPGPPGRLLQRLFARNVLGYTHPFGAQVTAGARPFVEPERGRFKKFSFSRIAFNVDRDRAALLVLRSQRGVGPFSSSGSRLLFRRTSDGIWSVESEGKLWISCGWTLPETWSDGGVEAWGRGD